jgi:hypothetical protein
MSLLTSIAQACYVSSYDGCDMIQRIPLSRALPPVGRLTERSLLNLFVTNKAQPVRMPWGLPMGNVVLLTPWKSTQPVYDSKVSHGSATDDPVSGKSTLVSLGRAWRPTTSVFCGLDLAASDSGVARMAISPFAAGF